MSGHSIIVVLFFLSILLGVVGDYVAAAVGLLGMVIIAFGLDAAQKGARS